MPMAKTTGLSCAHPAFSLVSVQELKLFQIIDLHSLWPNMYKDHVMFRDGESHNLSWNCGEEGETKTPSVLRLRSRQMRNMAAALLLSHGVPMIQMGDEYGHSKVCKSLYALCVVPQESAAVRAEHHAASQPLLYSFF